MESITVRVTYRGPKVDLISTLESIANKHGGKLTMKDLPYLDANILKVHITAPTVQKVHDIANSFNWVFQVISVKVASTRS